MNNRETEYLIGLVKPMDSIFKKFTYLYNRDIFIESIEENGCSYVVISVNGFFKYKVQIVGSRLVPNDVWYRSEDLCKGIMLENIRKALYKILEGIAQVPYPVGMLVFKIGKLNYVHSHGMKLMKNGEYELRIGDYYY